MAPAPDPGVIGLAEEPQRRRRHSIEAGVQPSDSNTKRRRTRRAFQILRQAYVLSGIFVVTFALYPWLAACFLLRYRPGQRFVPKVYHRIMRGLLGLNISVKGSPSSRRPLCVVANHTSWLDVIVITSLLSVVFVAKQEVASWPFFGWLAQLQRSIFVNRERRHQVHQAIGQVADALVAGEIICIFPEGTSTDGTDVAPFRSALIGAVHEALRRDARLPAIFIQPVSVTYVGSNRRLTVWAREDEIPFFPHLLQVACLRRIDVVLSWEDPISADMDSDRKLLARQLEETVRHSVAEANAQAGSAGQ